MTDYTSGFRAGILAATQRIRNFDERARGTSAWEDAIQPILEDVADAVVKLQPPQCDALRPGGEHIAVKFEAVERIGALERLVRDQQENASRVHRHPQQPAAAPMQSKPLSRLATEPPGAEAILTPAAPEAGDAAPSFFADLEQGHSPLAGAPRHFASPAVAAWRALSDDQRSYAISELADVVHLADDRDRIRGYESRVYGWAIDAALALLLSLAPEAGGDR